MNRVCRVRTGFTLIEVMVVVAGTVILVSLAVGLLHQVGKWGQASQKSADEAAGSYRMEQALRRELAQATDVEVNARALRVIRRIDAELKGLARRPRGCARLAASRRSTGSRDQGSGQALRPNAASGRHRR